MAQPTLYDAVPYSSFAHAPSHPDQLSTVAFLHGLEPPSPARCRMLELGCGTGATLIGVAYGLPESTAVGIDLAPTAIARARETANALDLENVEFHVGDVRGLADSGLGEFDYVVAHGLYSWVDHATRDALLTACHRHLAADGIAYLSFNTHPGGHLRRAIRELAMWQAGEARDPVELAERARRLFGKLSELRADSDPWGALLAAELPPLSTSSVDHLVHDLLSEDWEPVWFAQFARHASEHGLTYVAEASFHRVSGPWEPHVEDGLRELSGGDRIAYEQIVDFMVWRRFRDSLLCRTGRTVGPTIDMDRLAQLRFRPSGPIGGLGGEADPLLTALAGCTPPPVGFQRLQTDLGVEARALAEALFDAVRRGRVTAHLEPPALGRADTERPRMSALARLQARDHKYLTTLLGGVVELEGPVIRALLELADGSRTRDELRTAVAEAGGPLLDPAQLESALSNLAAMALIESG
jgi:SAM-dependent methyltransferase